MLCVSLVRQVRCFFAPLMAPPLGMHLRVPAGVCMDILTSQTHVSMALQALAAQQPAEDISVKDEPSEAKPQVRHGAFHHV